MARFLQMCSLASRILPKKCFKPNHLEYFRHSSLTLWNKDWKPGPYPRTEEERIAAAKKYNMIPEDYEPYPEEEGYGDYPMFPMTHMETRNPFESYDIPVYKRNYGEPVHPRFDECIEDQINFQQTFSLPFWKQMVLLWSVFGIFATILWNENTYFRLPDDKIQKQYPYEGVVHYTFEPADED